MLIKSLTVGNMSVCCYILVCEDTREAAVIDPGGDAAMIEQALKKMGARLKLIINTHGHPDHVAENASLKKATGAVIVMHEADAAFFGQPQVVQYFSALGLPFSPPPDRLVKDGETISFGKESLKVIHTPGHTPGGICLYSKPELFSGDTLFVGGVGRSDFPGGDGRQLFNAIRDKLLTLPNDTRVWPGHGYGGQSSTIGEEKRSNPFLGDDSWAR
jgi:glyoxylase-like metal-dependent hydrolase (beta-lactamase superfamily II)